jgi:hypothetical protein
MADAFGKAFVKSRKRRALVPRQPEIVIADDAQSAQIAEKNFDQIKLRFGDILHLVNKAVLYRR